MTTATTAAATVPPKLKACDRCAAIKQVCDRVDDSGGRACSRCTREYYFILFYLFIVLFRLSG